MTIYAHVRSYAAITAEGMCSPRVTAPWREDQNGPADIQRDQVMKEPFTGFGKLRIAEKLAFSAAALTIADCDGGMQSLGISLGTTCGSISTDLRYQESVTAGFPRPAFFSATLPSSPIAEIAIYFKLTGPNRAFAGENAPAAALEHAIRALHHTKAPGMLVIAVNAFDYQDRTNEFLRGAAGHSLWAYGFLLDADRRERNTRYSFRLDEPEEAHAAVDTLNQSYFSYIIDVIRAQNSPTHRRHISRRARLSLVKG